MKFEETLIPGAFVVDIEEKPDERGFFARVFCEDEFREQGLDTDIVQCNISFNKRKATLRGMHYQAAPHEETKLIRCTAGAVWDVILDLRPDSPVFKRWVGVELNARTRRMLYVPRGIAHGFITLEDATEVFYQMGTRQATGSARGVRWDDPAFGIEWPLRPEVISDRDRSYALWNQ